MALAASRVQVPVVRGRTHRVVQVRAIKVGDAFPEFTLKTDAGSSLSSKDMITSSFVLFSYPKADTPGCTVQACGFRDSYQEFEKKGFKVYGISADTPAEQAKWKAAQKFPYPLLCDEDYSVLGKLGMLKEPRRINRSHIVVEKGGKVIDTKIGVAYQDSVPEALKFVAEAKKL